MAFFHTGPRRYLNMDQKMRPRYEGGPVDIGGPIGTELNRYDRQKWGYIKKIPDYLIIGIAKACYDYLWSNPEEPDRSGFLCK